MLTLLSGVQLGHWDFFKSPPGNSRGFPGSAVVKNSPASAGDSVLILGLGGSPGGGGNGYPHQHGLSPWGCTESDATETAQAQLVPAAAVCSSASKLQPLGSPGLLPLPHPDPKLTGLSPSQAHSPLPGVVSTTI